MFGKVKSWIPINTDKELEKLIIEWQQKQIFYGEVPVSCDSMTCKDTTKSIPDKSKVLVYDLQIDFSNGLDNVWHKIPLGEPLLIIGNTYDGKIFRLCKTISFLDAINNYVRLTSYNKKYKDQWISARSLTSILKVVKVVE